MIEVAIERRHHGHGNSFARGGILAACVLIILNGAFLLRDALPLPHCNLRNHHWLLLDGVSHLISPQSVLVIRGEAVDNDRNG